MSAIDVPQAYSKVLENFQIPNHDRVLQKHWNFYKNTMSTIIEMPKLSDTMTVGTVVMWRAGMEKIANGDILAEIETDKATMELENFDDGVL